MPSRIPAMSTNYDLWPNEAKDNKNPNLNSWTRQNLGSNPEKKIV